MQQNFTGKSSSHTTCWGALDRIPNIDRLQGDRNLVKVPASNVLTEFKPTPTDSAKTVRPTKSLTVVHDRVRLEVLRRHLIHAAASVRGISSHENQGRPCYRCCSFIPRPIPTTTSTTRSQLAQSCLKRPQYLRRLPEKSVGELQRHSPEVAIGDERHGLGDLPHIGHITQSTAGGLATRRRECGRGIGKSKRKHQPTVAIGWAHRPAEGQGASATNPILP